VKPTKGQAWAGVVMIALPIIGSLLGIKYEQNNPTPVENTTNQTFELGSTRSDQDIEAICKTISDASMLKHITSRRH